MRTAGVEAQRGRQLIEIVGVGEAETAARDDAIAPAERRDELEAGDDLFEIDIRRQVGIGAVQVQIEAQAVEHVDELVAPDARPADTRDQQVGSAIAVADFELFLLVGKRQGLAPVATAVDMARTDLAQVDVGVLESLVEDTDRVDDLVAPRICAGYAVVDDGAVTAF